MIWADRVALVWALIAGGLMLINPHTDFPLGFVSFVLLVPWLALRAIHFIFTGGRRTAL